MHEFRPPPSPEWEPAEESGPGLRSPAVSRVSIAEAPRTPHPPKVLRSGTDPGRLLHDRYVVLDWIGRGGMADVFLARDVETSQLVAIKILAKEHRQSLPHRDRMLREASLGQLVSHRHVVRTLGAGQLDDGTPYIVLEPLVGETLHDFLERRRVMPVGQALPLLQQLADGLAAIHCAGVVHGDIKPRNVFLCGPIDEPVEIKIIDFGLSQDFGNDSDAADDETVAGTPEYLSPEQAAADPLDERSDVYAFGVVAFRWLTGELPFDSHLRTELLVHQLTSPAPPMSWLVNDIEPALDALVAVSLRKAPENRYQTMLGVLADLETIEDGECVIQGAPVTVYPDAYEPRNELGRRALQMLLRADHDLLSYRCRG